MTSPLIPELFIWLVGGVAAAWVLSVIAQVEDIHPAKWDVLIGAMVACAAGFVFSHTEMLAMIGFNLWSVVVAFISAFVILALLRLLGSIKIFRIGFSERVNNGNKRYKQTA